MVNLPIPVVCKCLKVTHFIFHTCIFELKVKWLAYVNLENMHWIGGWMDGWWWVGKDSATEEYMYTLLF